jgi:hypothetical protein
MLRKVVATYNPVPSCINATKAAKLVTERAVYAPGRCRCVHHVVLFTTSYKVSPCYGEALCEV